MECGACKKQFVRYSDLRRHVKRFHSNALENLAPLKNKEKHYKFMCICGKNFNYKYNLTAHSKSCNNQEAGVSDWSVDIKIKKCPLCSYENSFEKNFYKHFKDVHDIETVVQSLEFETLNNFKLWMSAKEMETKSKFIKYRGSSTTKIDYYCHRSGFFKSKSQGIRKVKTQGSNKINGFCPAKIEVFLNENGQYKVKFLETHIGHANDDLGHLFLTGSERQALAVKIASKIPYPAILEEIRDNNSDQTLNRLDLLTRKDLYNIEATYNLKSGAVRHQNDAVSVDAWVTEMKKDNSCVLLYKAQDSLLEDYPELKSSDFVLCIMNEGQAQVCRKFCNDVICIDGTHGLNSYQFEMHTLLVLDDLRQGFPCAFFISNRSDVDVLKLFFKVIKDHIGMTIKPKVFMSDMASAYYNAWLRVMDGADHRLFCSWHVLRAWNKNLALIPSKDKQVEVSMMLRSILEESDQQAFENLITNFISTTSADPATCEFSNYFRNNYLKNTSSWAYCYRLHTGINTNMHLERMHGTIKYIYLNGKNVKRLDKTITVLMRFVRDKVFERIITLHKGKVSSKLAALRSRHKASLVLSSDMVIENEEGWDIPSASKSFDLYNVQKNVISCNCALQCDDCKSCIHQYSCTCLDSAIKWNMCKHIHVVCRFVNSKLKKPTSTDDVDENNLYIHCDPKKGEAMSLKESLTNGIEVKKNNSVAEETEKIGRHFNDILKNIRTLEQVAALKKLIAPIEPTMMALLQEPKSSLVSKIEGNSKIPENKKIIPQRFYSTKKKRTNTKQKKILIK